MSKRSVVKAVESHGSEEKMDRLEKKMDRLLVAGVQGARKFGKTYPVCEGCGELGHEVASCGVVQDEETEEEEVNYVQGERKYNNMSSNTYHPGLRNHPNFSYGNPNTQQNSNFQGSFQKTCYQSNQKQYGNSSGSGQSYQKSYQQGQGNSSGNKKESLKDVVELLKQMKADQDTHNRNQETHNKALNQRLELQEKANAARDKQVSHLAEEMASLKRNPSKLPSDTLKNPSHQSSSSSNSKNAHVSAITIEDSVENDTVEEFETGAPLISIQIGEFKTTKALVDYDASVSILPRSVYDRFDFGPLQEVDTTLVLVDFTRRRPRGKLVGVAVKVGDFYYPEDFLVLDYAPVEKEEEPRVILGRPFLATSNAQINCRDRTVCMTFGNRKLILSIFSNSYDYSFENK
ncbi:uncharacterized protein LOC143632803 [Bidens hawaiensis]|uniref:uncharacterized protein LOC143632803 n=1 Tax=Bidens hawaiensis TaxID=980011 RepID=UPI004048F5CC